MRPGSIRGALLLGAAAGALLASGAGAAPPARGGLVATFREAAHTYHVPARLLLAVGYVNTRLRMPAHPAMNGGYGVMDLTPRQLRRAARLAPVDAVAARDDLRQNVRAGAALLAALRGGSSWYDALVRLGGAPFADQVFLRLGRRVPLRGTAAITARADYPGAHWLPASPSNYSRSNRPLSHRITMVVIHVTDGSYGGTLSWFRNPRAHATAHYVVRSSDGDVTQMVREKDEAWHAGNGAVNDASVGIEHEGFTGNCAWYTDAMYRASAQLSAYLAVKYQIPIDRKHFIGHDEVPDPNHPGQFGGYSHHTDPGSCWNWPKYMGLVRNFAGASVGTTLQRIADDSTRAFAAPRGWRRRTSPAGYGRSFSVSAPNATRNAARFKLRIPETGRYALYGWWPAAASRNSSVPVGIDTPAGRQWIRVDQRTGSVWTYLGTFALNGGTSTVVRFSPRTTASGSIAADAVKLELLAPRPAAGLEAQAEGWAATARGLSATRDSGVSWASISPPGLAPEQIRGIRLAGANGWLVAATGTRRPLALYRTTDRGASWTVSPLPAPRDVDVAAPADVVALDDAHLFVGLRLEPNRWSLSRGLLLRTSTSGASWTKTKLPAGGRLAFPTPEDGWLVGGLANERLYASHDGGTTWRKLKLAPAISGAASVTYGLPTFTSETDGVLPVSLAAGTRSTLAFETSFDGGRSWEVAARVRIGKSLRFAATVPTAVADPELWLAAVGTKLVSITDAGLTRTTVGTLPGAVSRLQFASAQVGWAEVPATCARTAPTCPVRLFATADGGVTWARLRPP